MARQREASCHAVEYRDHRTNLQRLLDRLFPSRYCELPVVAHEERFKDVISHHVASKLTIPDRLRVLISGKIKVESRMLVQNTPGEIVSNAVCYILPPNHEIRGLRR